MPNLHHGVYAEEWGLGTTLATLEDFTRSLMGAGAPNQSQIIITFKFDDGTTHDARVSVMGLHNPDHFDEITTNWTWLGQIDCRDIPKGSPLKDVWAHQGKVSFRTDMPYNTLMVRHHDT